MGRLDKLYLGTNTKMYKTISDTAAFLSRLDELTGDLSPDILELFVLPSYTALDAAVKAAARGHIKIGAQNMGYEDAGQFTGEISPLMLREIGIHMVMAGHSERRHVLMETDFDVEKKITKALEHGFTPLLCVGETLEQKTYGLSDEVLSTQLKIGLHAVPPSQASQLMVAYEPVWAIGVHGIPADEQYAEEKHKVIKKVLAQLFGKSIGSDIPVLYGGSVNPRNAGPLIQMPHIDGLFIGRSAWDADRFHGIIRDVLPLFLQKKAGEYRRKEV